MKLLLDTHILLWNQAGAKRLSRRVARLLNDSRNERWISSTSLLEIYALHHRGRLRLNLEPGSWFSDAIQKAALREAPFTNEVAQAIGSFVLSHGDPIDTILVATARVYGLTLVTSDTKLIEAAACPVLANR